MTRGFQELARKTYGVFRLPREFRQPQWLERAQAFLLDSPEHASADVRDKKPGSSEYPSSLEAGVQGLETSLPRSEGHIDSSAPTNQPPDPLITSVGLPSSINTNIVEQQETPEERIHQYARGPNRIVNARDGPAMLLTESLMGDISRSIQSSREFEILEQQYKKLKRAVRSTERLLENLNVEVESSDNDDDKIRIRQEIETQEPTYRKNIERRDELEREVRSSRDNLEYMQILLLGTFEKILDSSNLLDIPNMTPEENHDSSKLQSAKSAPAVHPKPYEDPCIRPDSVVQAQSDEGFIISRNSAMIKKSEMIAMLEEVERTRQNLFQAQDVFDATRDSQERDKIEFRNLAAQGIVAEFSEDELDLFHFQKSSENTRALIVAEEEHKKAKAIARNLGILENQLDQESDFVDELEDGYRESRDADTKAVPDLAYMEYWNQEVFDCRNPFALQLQEPEPDDWEFKAVAMFDTRSCVDCDEDHRRRINQWQQSMRTEREECEIQKMQISLKRRDSLPPLESRKRVKTEVSDHPTLIRRGSYSELPGGTSERLRLVTYTVHTVDAILFPNLAIDR